MTSASESENKATETKELKEAKETKEAEESLVGSLLFKRINEHGG